MFSAIRRRLHVSPSMVIAVVALVFAATGGAFAMGGGGSSPSGTLTASAAKSKAKSAPKGKAGPRGPAGPAGKNGAIGATGSAGAQGVAGAAGPQGPAGATGAKGETGATGLQGEKGATGAVGAKGSPWTAGGTLPSEKTETGVWGTGSAGEGGSADNKFFPISFTLPLEKAPQGIFVPADKESEPGCPGRGGGSFPASGAYTPTIPMAEPGKLCVYAGVFEEATFEHFYISVFEEGSWYLEPGVGASGTSLDIKCLTKYCLAAGTWAVTAE
jgi:Collagen triple helix repeat (20 copies)